MRVSDETLENLIKDLNVPSIRGDIVDAFRDLRDLRVLVRNFFKVKDEIDGGSFGEPETDLRDAAGVVDEN